MAALSHLEGAANYTDDWYPLLDMIPQVQYSSHVAMAVIMIVVLTLALTGNTVVVAVFVGCKKLRTPSNMLIVNLAAADLLLALTGFPLLIVSSLRGAWAFSTTVCHFYGASATMFGLMSINTLMFISLDRLVVIIGPHHLSRITYRHAACCVSLVWLYSAVWAAMPLLGWNRYIIEGYGTTCSIDYFTRVSPHNHFLIVLLLADYVFPCFIIFICYTVIFFNVHKHTSHISNIMAPEKKKQSRAKWSKTDLKIARTCLVVIVLYCLTWTPYAVVVLVGQYSDRATITPTASMLPAIFAKFSTIYNPIVYALSHPRVKPLVRDFVNIVRGNKAGSGHPLSGHTDSSRTGSGARTDRYSKVNRQDVPQEEQEQEMVEGDMLPMLEIPDMQGNVSS